MDVWIKLDKLQTKINGELKNAGSPFYVRIDDYSYKTGTFEYKLRRRDSLSVEGNEKTNAAEVVLRNFAVWKKRSILRA